jgi:hypothetical protein
MPLESESAILRPYHAAEALTVRQAATMAKRSVRTIRDWAARFDLGRRIGGSWAISSVALLMHLEANHDALSLYHAGDRSSTTVTAYFERCGVPLPRRGAQDQIAPVVGIRERRLSEVNGC